MVLYQNMPRDGSNFSEKIPICSKCLKFYIIFILRTYEKQQTHEFQLRTNWRFSLIKSVFWVFTIFNRSFLPHYLPKPVLNPNLKFRTSKGVDWAKIHVCKVLIFGQNGFLCKTVNLPTMSWTLPHFHLKEAKQVKH